MGNTFKEQVYEDFKNVLMNLEEYGRECSWNGYPLQIAEDARINTQLYEAQGVNFDKKIIYCREIDLASPPSVTEQVNFDGEYWYVSDVKTPFSYFIITLERRIS